MGKEDHREMLPVLSLIILSHVVPTRLSIWGLPSSPNRRFVQFSPVVQLLFSSHFAYCSLWMGVTRDSSLPFSFKILLNAGELSPSTLHLFAKSCVYSCSNSWTFISLTLAECSSSYQWETFQIPSSVPLEHHYHYSLMITFGPTLTQMKRICDCVHFFWVVVWDKVRDTHIEPLLALDSSITPDYAQWTYEILGIEPESAAGKAQVPYLCSLSPSSVDF